MSIDTYIYIKGVPNSWVFPGIQGNTLESIHELICVILLKTYRYILKLICVILLQTYLYILKLIRVILLQMYKKQIKLHFIFFTRGEMVILPLS